MFQFLELVALGQSKQANCAQETSGANAAVQITIAASAGRRHVVPQIIWSYNGAPTGGRLTVTGIAGEDIDLDITAGGPGPANFPPLVGDTNTAVVITLAAGGAGVVGKLNVMYMSVAVPI